MTDDSSTESRSVFTRIDTRRDGAQSPSTSKLPFLPQLRACRAPCFFQLVQGAGKYHHHPDVPWRGRRSSFFAGLVVCAYKRHHRHRKVVHSAVPVLCTSDIYVYVMRLPCRQLAGLLRFCAHGCHIIHLPISHIHPTTIQGDSNFIHSLFIS